MDRKMVNFIKEQYPPGTRIRLNSMEDPYAPVAPGTEGEVDFVDDIGTIHMKWDNGRALGIVPGEDSFSVLPPKLTTLKLYMPLTADFYERSEYGDLEPESTILDGRALRGYQDQIMAELVKNRMPEETERGLMHWYSEADSVNTKVHSAVFAVEERDRKLWGVAECRIAGELSAAEMDTLKEYITGQASDGWGEHFEQREILVDGGSELYVHLWNIVQTETTETRTYLYITVSHKSVDEMAAQYGFNQEQKDYLNELLQDKNNTLWSSVLYGINTSDNQITTVALSQVGNVGGVPYWSWYGFGSRVEWCACFVSWCANECGYIDTGVIPKFADCQTGVQWFKDRGQWLDGSAEPLPGMIIFYDWESNGLDGQPDHTAIVWKIEDGYVYTVEGNWDDECKISCRPIGEYQILGYGAPAY